MCSNALIYALGPALALALCSCSAPRLALAEELDVPAVLERLETIRDYEASSESLTYDMSQDVAQMRQDLSDVGDSQKQQLEEIRGLRQELLDTSLTLEQRNSLEKLDSIDKTLNDIKEAVVPSDKESEVETKGETRDAEDEVEPDVQVAPATLDDIARLLMINVATTAMLLGVQIWRPLYDVLAGVE